MVRPRRGFNNNGKLFNVVENRYLDCLKYALDNGCILDEEILIKLASNNNFKVIKFLNENYPELLDISRFIIVNNYKWDESLTSLIAFNGNLDALKISSAVFYFELPFKPLTSSSENKVMHFKGTTNS